MYFCMPIGDYYGWAVCGKSLAKEFRHLTDFVLVPEPFEGKTIGGQITDFELRPYKQYGLSRVDGPVLQAMNPVFKSLNEDLKGTLNAGYTFFEKENLKQEEVDSLNRWDLVIAGSKWCADILKRHDIDVIDIPQGVDPIFFNVGHQQKFRLLENFVVFSGGRFVSRKGQDIVLKAVAQLQRKYDDVVLATCWYDLWHDKKQGDFWDFIRRKCVDEGLDMTRIIHYPLVPQLAMPFVYQNTDVGLFANRVEGGTNLVLMEYMACGKPVVASYLTGHKDILTGENSLHLRDNSVDEAVTQIDWVYNNRHRSVHFYGSAAAYDMREKFTWRHSAERFLKCLTEKQ